MRPSWRLAVLLGVTFLVFGYTLFFPFMGDDIPQIVQNPRVHSWSSLPQYFSTHLWIQVPGAVPRFYRPLFLVILRIVHAIFGLWTPGWHFVLVASHLVAVAAVYWLVCQWKNRQTALLAAALFSLHPVHAEVVSWVSAVSEPWLAVALIGSLILARREGIGDLVAACALFAVALLLKETAIVWPLVIFVALYDGVSRSIRRTAPFVSIAVGYLVLRVVVLGHVSYPLLRSVPPSGSYVPTALAHYFLHLVWPVGLSTYCNLHPTWSYLLLVLPLLAGLGWIAFRGQYERTAVLILIAPLLPVLNLSGMQLSSLVQDRYLYIPSVGFAMLAVVVLNRLPKPAIALVLALMVTGCFLETRTFSDGEHFYERGFKVAPDNPEVRDGLGRIYANQGKFQQAIQMLEPMVRNAHFPAATRQQSLLTLAYCYEHLGNIPSALAYYGAADDLERSPEIEQYILTLRSRLPEAR